jgi:hypothetical protein
MKAFASRIRSDGSDAVGSDNRVLGPYRDLPSLARSRYGLRSLTPGRWHIEAYRDWDRRYSGRPDFDLTCHIAPGSPPLCKKR